MYSLAFGKRLFNHLSDNVLPGDVHEPFRLANRRENSGIRVGSCNTSGRTIDCMLSCRYNPGQICSCATLITQLAMLILLKHYGVPGLSQGW